MDMYLIFNDIDSRDLPIDLEITGWSRPLLPESRDEVLYIEGVDGSYLNKKPFGNRPITVRFRAIFNNEKERINTVEVLTKWLYSNDFVRLVMSDESDLYYLAKVFDGTDLEPELFRSEFSITFVCQPLKYGGKKVVTVDQNNGSFLYDGTYEVEPFISFRTTQQTNLLEFELNGEKIIYEDQENSLPSNSNITIDVEAKEFRVNGNLKVLEVDGYFIPLKVGENTFSSNINLSSVTFSYQNLYLYRVDNDE